MPESERLKEIKRVVSFLLEQRQTWDTHHKEIADFIHPRYGRFMDKGDSTPNDGKKRMGKVLDGTAMRGLNVLSAGLFTAICSPSRPFFRMSFMDKSLLEYGPARMWADVVEKRMYWVLEKSGFYQATHHAFRELPLFASACTWADPHPQRILHWQTRTWGEYAWGINGWGEVDTCSLAIQLPIRGIAERWGTRAFSESSKRALEKDPFTWKTVTFLVRPREWVMPGKMDVLNMPYQLVAFMEDGDDILFESGRQEFPVMTPRWDVIGPSIYGFGPGHDILPDVKMLQELQEQRLVAVAKSSNPPVKVPTGYTRRLLTVPGGQNPVSAQSPESIGPLYQVNPDLRGLLDALQDTREAIRSGQYVDVFLLLSQFPDMTATEALIREQEKLQVLGPVAERFIGEYLNRALELAYAEMVRIGLVPPPPPEIAGQELKLEHVSTLARVQERAGFQGLGQFLAVAEQIVAGHPETADKVDFDQAIDEIGQMFSVPPGIIRSDDDVAKLRQVRAQAQAQAAQGEKMAGMASAAKDLAAAKTDEPSLLTQAMDSMGGGAVPAAR